MAKSQLERFTTPRGVFIYPHLTEPDTKFVKPDGEYHTKFAVDADEAEEFVARLNKLLDDYIAENPDDLKPAVLKKSTRAELYEEEVDDEGNETGRLIFKFKLKAKVETKTKSWSQKPRLFDAKAQPIEGDISIWTGSEGKVSGEIMPYFMQNTKQFGLSLRMKAVQILKLVEGGGASASDYGFSAEDDGYESNSSGAANGFTPEADDDDDGGEEEF